MRKRIEELDGLRGIAAVIVVLFHYFKRYDQIYGHQNLNTNWTAYGYNGVHLFFIISGFVIFWSLNNTKKPLDFIVSRFARLYPIYWAALILTFLFITTFGLPGREVSSSSFFANFLMFHEYFNIPNVDGAYWTLKVELTFYLWIFIIFILNLLKQIDFFILFLLIIGIVLNFNIIETPEIIKELLFIKWLPFFSIGICLYKIYIKEFKKITIFNLLLAIINTIFIFSFKSFLFYCFFTILVHCAVNQNLRFLSNSILKFFGSISYSLYLLHQNIGYVIIRKGYEYNLNSKATMILTILIIIFISYLSTLYIEKPAAKFIKKTYKKHRKIFFYPS